MIIRKATYADSEALANCLFLAMEDIIYKFLGERNPGKASAFLLHFVQRENNQYSYQNCFVAQEANQVVAAVNIYDGKKLQELRQPVTDYLKDHFYRTIKIEDETQAGEIYIDSLGVNPTRQGKGIGTQVLKFLINEYVHKQNQTLGLLVDDNNPDAKRLYLKLGFNTVGKKVLLAKPMEHLQIKAYLM
jgi:ribosomal protein S18 acetylase RimI-like enzyme